MSTENSKPKESVFVRIPHGVADQIRDAIDSENLRRALKKRPPLFMRGEKHNLIRWIMRAGARELRRVERGPRGRQIASPPDTPKDPVSISRSMEVDVATADRIRVAVHTINRRRAALGKPPVCVYVGQPSVAAFYLRSTERELRRIERETRKRAAS